MKIIKSTNGYDIMVDDKWYPLLSLVTWSVSSMKHNVCHTGAKIHGRAPIIYLSRVVTSCPIALQVDHVNHNRLDNREENLRIVTRSQNSINRKVQSNNKSGRVGVTWNREHGKWHSYIGIRRKHVHLGWFDSFTDAIKAREIAEAMYFGQYTYNGTAAVQTDRQTAQE